MKKRQAIVAAAGVLLVSTSVVLGVSAIASRLLGSDHEEPACSTNVQTEHTLTIEDGKLSASNAQFHHCDRLTISNRDDQLRLMAFGVHDHHQRYGNTTEKMLLKDQQLTVTLTERDTYTFHDHLHDEVKGTFTVE